jgi:hypothetical protein
MHCQAPSTTRTRDLIAVPAIVEPHQGTSYNPPADAHQELMEQAAAIEQKRLEAAEKLAETKAKMEAAKGSADVYDMSVAPGMTVQQLAEDDDEEDDDETQEDGAQAASKKDTKPKTTAQKNKAARLLKEVRPSNWACSASTDTRDPETRARCKSPAKTPTGVDQRRQVYPPVNRKTDVRTGAGAAEKTGGGGGEAEDARPRGAEAREAQGAREPCRGPDRGGSERELAGAEGAFFLLQYVCYTNASSGSLRGTFSVIASGVCSRER